MALKSGAAKLGKERSVQENADMEALFALVRLGVSDSDDSKGGSVAVDSEKVQYDDLNREYAASRGQVYRYKR